MERAQTTIVVAVIRNEKGELLIAQRNQPSFPAVHLKWEFVGGGIEFNEDPETALIREVREESGLEVKITRLLPKILTHYWKHEHKEDQILILSYECEIIGGSLQPGLDEEIADLKFIDIKNLNNYDTLPNINEAAELLDK